MPAESFISEPYRGLADDREQLAAIREQLDSVGVVELIDFLTPEGHALLKQQILDLESKATTSSTGSNQKYALKDARKAHEDLEARKTTGSTVLLP